MSSITSLPDAEPLQSSVTVILLIPTSYSRHSIHYPNVPSSSTDLIPPLSPLLPSLKRLSLLQHASCTSTHKSLLIPLITTPLISPLLPLFRHPAWRQWPPTEKILGARPPSLISSFLPSKLLTTVPLFSHSLTLQPLCNQLKLQLLLLNAVVAQPPKRLPEPPPSPLPCANKHQTIAHIIIIIIIINHSSSDLNYLYSLVSQGRLPRRSLEQRVLSLLAIV